MVTNTGAFDVAGPINVVFDNLGDPSVVFFGNDGAPADANGFQIMADGEILGAGESSSRQTVTFENSRLLDLTFDHRVLATVPPNQLPEFSTAPIMSASVGETYRYDALAEDPDGIAVTYVLTKAPESASVDPESGQIDWMPSPGSDANVGFELRAYDSRGAYRRQQWMVDVTGANRPPVVSPIADVFATEGDLIEIPVSGFDPDGDDLFYFADNLPPGAVFDPASQAIRWRPGGDDAGVYEDVSLHVSDGFVEASVRFEMVVANNNVPPVLAPIPDRVINEGDPVFLVLSASDDDGDPLRYRSPNLPPGAFLDPNTGVFEWTPTFDQHGEFEFTLYADDGQTIDEQSAVITVNNVNGPVKFPEFGAFEIFEGQTLQLRIAAADPESPEIPTDPLATGDDLLIDYEASRSTVTYAHDALPPGASFDVDRQLFFWTPGFDAAGTYQIEFTATDDGDATGVPTTDSVTVSLMVLNANGAPGGDRNRESNGGGRRHVGHSHFGGRSGRRFPRLGRAHGASDHASFLGKSDG